MYYEKIVNLETGEETLRDFTADEIAKIEAAQAKSLAEQLETEAKKASRAALLDKLGITADEAQLLLGSN
jgi:hypothetical protein